LFLKNITELCDSDIIFWHNFFKLYNSKITFHIKKKSNFATPSISYSLFLYCKIWKLFFFQLVQTRVLSSLNLFKIQYIHNSDGNSRGTAMGLHIETMEYRKKRPKLDVWITKD